MGELRGLAAAATTDGRAIARQRKTEEEEKSKAVNLLTMSLLKGCLAAIGEAGEVGVLTQPHELLLQLLQLL